MTIATSEQQRLNGLVHLIHLSERAEKLTAEGPGRQPRLCAPIKRLREGSEKASDQALVTRVSLGKAP